MRRVFIPGQGTKLRREGAARLTAEWLNAEARWKNGQSFAEQTGGHPDDAPEGALPVERVWCEVSGCRRREAHTHEAVVPPLHESGFTRAQRRSVRLPRKLRTQRARAAMRSAR